MIIYRNLFVEGIIIDCDSLISAGSRKEEKKELLGRLVQLFSDAYFKVGTLDTAQLVAANDVPVFQYRSALSKLTIYMKCQLVFLEQGLRLGFASKKYF